jgi:PKD domain
LGVPQPSHDVKPSSFRRGIFLAVLAGGSLAAPAWASAALTMTTAPSDPSGVNTPAFGGAGALPGPSVTVVLAPVAGGVDPPDLQAAPEAGGVWNAAVASPALPDGTYTATATQPGNDPSPKVQFRIDTTWPALTVTQPAVLTANQTPVLGGAAGDALGDSPSVTVDLSAGSGGTGTLVRSSTVTRNGTAWTDAPPALAPGQYSVRATQVDVAGHKTTTPWRDFTIVAADFTIVPDQVLVGSKVTLTALTKDVSYSWDLDDDGAFDDGTTQQVTRTVTSQAPQRVRLKITAPNNTSNIATRWITPGNLPPNADFDISPAGPIAGQAVTLTSTSRDPEGLALASEAWDLDGDGNFDEATGGMVSIAFPAPGTYRVGLRVIDQAGAMREATKYVTVAAPGLSDPGPLAGAGSGSPAGATAPSPTASAALATTSRRPLLSPFPIVRIVGELTLRGVRLRALSVAAPKGAVVRARCAGQGCPREIRALRARRAAGLRIRSLERRELWAGTVVEVFVTARGKIGKYTRFAVRRGKSPKREDRCLAVNGRSPIACPVG